MVTDSAMGWKMRPSWRCSAKMGICAAMMMSMENSVGRPTSLAASMMTPRRSRSSMSSPRSARRCMMFSTTITAPSTMMPKSMAPRLSRLAGTPMTFRPMKVASSDSGITTTTARLARRLDRNRYSTSETSSAPSTRLRNTVVSVLSMSQVRS